MTQFVHCLRMFYRFFGWNHLRRTILTGAFIIVVITMMYKNYDDAESFRSERPWIFVITATYKRLEQKAMMTSLSSKFIILEKVHWIVVEDSNETSDMVETLLKQSKLVYTHLFDQTSSYRRKHCCDPGGNPQRNHAIEWLCSKYRNMNDVDGVVYFADDDNIYDIRLFNNYIRNVQSVGIWPVAFAGGAIVETPVVSNGVVTGWNVRYGPQRKFATDTAGFAVNLKLFLQSKANFSDVGCEVINGMCHLESYLLEKLNITLKDLQPFGYQNGAEILVWHMKSTANGHIHDGHKGFIV